MTGQDYNFLLRAVDTVVCALKHKDMHTQLHSKRVVNLSHELGLAYGLSESDLKILDIAAYCHDIGKIGIPDDILHKPGKLNLDEWETMKGHSKMGEEIVRHMEVKNSDIISKAVRHHHENIDGSGYPDQLEGHNIPIFSRIISIVDSYDAITVNRPYCEKKPHVFAMEIIDQEEGSMFDPDLVVLFKKLIENSEYKSLE